MTNTNHELPGSNQPEEITIGVTAFDELAHGPLFVPPNQEISFRPNFHYEKYLRLHKILVGKRGAGQLEEMYEGLKDESMPRYLTVAGWAAAEAAIIQHDRPTTERLELLSGTLDCWRRAIRYQKWLNATGPDFVAEHAYPHRIALDMASLPLLEGLVRADLSSETCETAFRDTLNIAQHNVVYQSIAALNEDVEAINAHAGLGYECNAILSVNRHFSPQWFVIPSMARADTGYYHRQQTHDLLVIHQEQGQIKSMTPVEIKSSASARDRMRYRALLVRGKMHLSQQGGHRPRHTLDSITAVYEGDPSAHHKEVADEVSDRFSEMIRMYRSGEMLGELATKRSIMRFHDNGLVVANFPGLQ